MDEKEKILNFAQTVFLKEGIYKTSMDYIAREMRISKKTIYKYFTSKDELVREASRYLQHKITSSIAQVVESDISSIEKMNGVLQVLISLGLKVNDKWLQDLEIHYPQVWQELSETREKAINKYFGIIFIQGQKEKLFKDYPLVIIITAFLSAVSGIVNPAFLFHTNFSIHEAAKITFEIILNGILTEQGREFYKQLKEENKL